MVMKFEFLIHINIFLTYMEKMNLEFYDAKKIQKQTKIFVNFPKTFLKNILINYSIC